MSDDQKDYFLKCPKCGNIAKEDSHRKMDQKFADGANATRREIMKRRKCSACRKKVHYQWVSEK